MYASNFRRKTYGTVAKKRSRAQGPRCGAVAADPREIWTHSDGYASALGSRKFSVMKVRGMTDPKVYKLYSQNTWLGTCHALLRTPFLDRSFFQGNFRTFSMIATKHVAHAPQALFMMEEDKQHELSYISKVDVLVRWYGPGP